MAISTPITLTGLRPLPFKENAAAAVTAPIIWQDKEPCCIENPLASNVPMAGDMSVQQSTIKAKTLCYKGSMKMPFTPKGYHQFLRLDSVGCFAALRLNGVIAAMHIGSHTVWECAIPTLEKDDELQLELELKEGVGVFSPYQKVGILRSISLITRPTAAISSLIVHTDFAIGAEDLGTIKVNYGVEGISDYGNISLEAKVSDINGDCVLAFSLDPTLTWQEAFVKNIQGWCAENPCLYSLTLALKLDDQMLHQATTRFGFTSIQRSDPQVLWNGAVLKLKGINYREPLPQEGHCLRDDLVLLKKANINFLRSLFYPFSEQCLELCDELGFYVEQSAPFQEVDQGIASTQNTPNENHGYISQLQEMILASISHPCVAIYCLGADCSWGYNFRSCRQFAEKADPKRLLDFFLPMTIPEEDKELDIWSVANIDWRQPMDGHYDQMVIFHTPGAHNEIGYATGNAPQSGKPVLHCAFATPPCYNRNEAEKDYGIHTFWGESIQRMWDKMQATEGCLGGAVMAAYDEDGRAFPRIYAHNWGVCDANHQPKPELHSLAMAYAPVALVSHKQAEDTLIITLQNRFVHTNFANINFTVLNGNDKTTISLNAAPNKNIEFTIPYTATNEVIVEYCGGGSIGAFSVIEAVPLLNLPCEIDGGSYDIVYKNDNVIAQNSIYSFSFSQATGLLTNATVNGNSILSSGPYLQATRLTLGKWQGKLQHLNTTNKGVQACVVGKYGAVCDVKFTIDIKADGTLVTDCHIVALNKPMPHAVKAGVGVDPGGLNEYGIAYIATHELKSLDWARKAQWGSTYPKGHTSRGIGTANRNDTYDFTAMKHHAVNALIATSNCQIVVPEQGDISLRLEEIYSDDNVFDDRHKALEYTGAWHLMDDYCGNYCGTETLSDNANDTVRFTFVGNGISVFGAKDYLYGFGEAWVDDGMVQQFSQYLEVVDRPGASRGYEKRYGLPLATFNHLSNGTHTLSVRVVGKSPSGAQGSFVAIDKLVVHTENQQKPVRVILNRGFNYARLVRGNYMNPAVCFTTGDSIRVTLRLSAVQQGSD